MEKSSALAGSSSVGVKALSLLMAYCIIAGQYYLAIYFIHWLGDPMHGVNALGPIRNPLLYRPAQFIFWLYELFWMALIVLTYLPLRLFALKLVRVICGIKNSADQKADPVKRVFSWLTPVLVISWTTLFIAPFNSYKWAGMESEMAVGTQQSIGDFIVYMTNASFMVVIALGLVLFTILFVGLFARSSKAGVGAMFAGIFLGIITAVGLGFCLTPGVEWLHAHFGGTPAFFILFAFYSVISATGVGLMSRKETK